MLTTFADSLNEIQFVIWSYGNDAYWGPNFCGFTTDYEKAGRYTFAHAADICAIDFKQRDEKYYGPRNAMIPLLNEKRKPKRGEGE